MGKAERGVLPVIASHRGRGWGGPEVTGPFTRDKKPERKERGTGREVGPSQQEKGDGAAAEHFKGMIKDISHQFIHL